MNHKIKSNIRRNSLGEQLELYRNVLIWDTRLSSKLQDYKEVESKDDDRGDIDEFRRENRRYPLKKYCEAQSSSESRESHTSTGSQFVDDLARVWETFCRQTSFHGVKNVVCRDRRRCSRLFWLFLVIGMAVAMYYTLAVLILEYYEYKTVTKSEIKINQWTIFPSVTMCNACPFKNLDGRMDSNLFKIIADTSHLFQNDLSINFSDPEVQSLLQTDIFDIQNTYAFTAEELFFLAKYENVDLNIYEAFEVTETAYGRCFTFNGPEYIAKNGPRLATFDGRESGLRLFVHIHQDNYFVYDDLTAGVRMFVAHHPETPRIRQDGIDIHPGTSTRLALSPVQYTFLPAPYKSYGDQPCLQIEAENFQHKMVNATYYSYDKCIEQCHNYKASINCSCYSHLLYVPNLRRCTLGDIIHCFSTVRENLTDADCDCPRPCTFTRYDTTMSASQTPSRVSAKLLSHLINASSAAELRYHYLLPRNDVLGEDYLEIRVYFDTMMVRHERHESQYTFNSVFAFLGGQMGFFIGASLVTLAELMETVILSAYIFVCKKLMMTGQMTTKSTVVNST